MMKTFPLADGVTTREITSVIRAAHAQGLKEFEGRIPKELVADESIRKHKGKRRYVFGMHTSLRDTLVAHYEVGSGEIGVVFPNDYRGWDTASIYDQLRVRIYDLIVHHANLRDKSKPADVDNNGNSRGNKYNRL